MEYLYLFINSFISATLFPLGSEALLIYYISENLNYIYLLIVASIGNTFGSILNYYLGLKGEQYLINKKILNNKKIQKYKKYFDKYGAYTLFLSWMPIIGDGFTFIAGIFRFNIRFFILIVFISKTFRYIFITYVYIKYI